MQLFFNTKANLSGNHCLSNLSATMVTTHRSQIGMSTAVNIWQLRLFAREQCPFVVYSTYLMPSSPCNNFSCSCTPCVLYCLPQGTILVNSCNSGDKCNCQNNKSWDFLQCGEHQQSYYNYISKLPWKLSGLWWQQQHCFS